MSDDDLTTAVWLNPGERPPAKRSWRPSKRLLLVVGGVALVAVIGGGVAVAMSGDDPPPANKPMADGPHTKKGHENPLGPDYGSPLHSETVVEGAQGIGTKIVVIQKGTVTAVSATSISLRSSDDYSATYVVNATTKSLAGAVDSLKTGQILRVTGVREGTGMTALIIGPGQHSEGKKKPVKPSPSPSGGATTPAVN
jgi:hypothetical protein